MPRPGPDTALTGRRHRRLRVDGLRHCGDLPAQRLVGARGSARQRELGARGSPDMASRIDNPNLDVEPDDVLVLRNAGPKGAPGMADAGYLSL